MTDKTHRLFDVASQAPVDVLYRDNGDNTYSPIAAKNKLARVTVSITREDNATPYSIGDVVSGSAATPVVYEIPNLLGIAGGTGALLKVLAMCNEKSVVPVLRIHFFSASTVTVAGDNLLHITKAADFSKYLGYIDLPALSTGGDTSNSNCSQAFSQGQPLLTLVAAAATRSIWFSVETRSVVTLTAQSTVNITFEASSD